MSQHDYVVGNDDGASVRVDLNNLFAAIRSNNSDASVFPSGPVQCMSFTQALSATQQLEWKHDGAEWVLERIIDPTNHKVYPANVRQIHGLTLSNNGSDSTNDVDIAAGWTAADTDGCPLILLSALTKRLDAAWAVGTNQGGLDTGSIANTTYHVHLIRRSDTGVVDVLFSTSATAPTMPADYDQSRRIGSIVRASGAIRGFRQIGDSFRWASPSTDRNSTSAAASALLTLQVPLGIVVQPMMNVTLGCFASVTCNIALGDAAAGGTQVTVCQVFTGAGDSSDASQSMVAPFFSTNTSAQIYFAQTNTAGTPANSMLITVGWIDRRGQDEA